MDNISVILDAAAALLEAHGPEALTARAVCDASGIKAPTLYHYFGGKQGLERALIERGMAEFMQKKRMPPPSADPLEQLKSGWDIAVEFALKRPALWRLHAQYAMTHPEVFADAYALMQSRIQRLVDLGIFNGPVDVSARSFWAACQGVLALILQGHSNQDVEFTSEALFDAVTARLRRL
ncbi:TetR/AcrR family transcriptional regulator [Herbaspirillum rhizosphaerae]|uniref:TetR/AcrR family transcriptional regulator n=1 Tax=Herbaspirillum rhizosphaerae TaxID=346179 RepID=A0ABW8Z5S1_9BURK